ncbi:hypothetical protein AB3N59_16890 [Leptospira sp. WS92.C1]
MKLDFSVHLVDMNLSENFSGVLAVVPVEDLTSPKLCEVVDRWTEILENAEELVFSNSIFEDSEPWFGFGASVGNHILDEQSLFSSAETWDSSFENATIKYIKTLTRYNTINNNGGLITHEEMETGTFAVLWLLQKDLKYLSLYLEYLNSLDLDLTVAQLDVLFSLAKQYSPLQLAPLKRFAMEKDAQLLNDWLVADRMWQK